MFVAREPKDAARRFLDTLGRITECVTAQRLFVLPEGYGEPGVLYVVAFGPAGEPVKLRAKAGGQSGFMLDVRQWYVIVEDERTASRPIWRVTTKAYEYRILDSQASELLVFHFQAILAGLREEPITLILTVGGDQDPAAFGEQPPHVHVECYIPQSLLFPRCDVVINHGGFGTVLTAIDHGLPMVFIQIAADQPDNARRCADLGLAEVIAPDQRMPESIRAATRAVLRAPRYRRTAERLRDEMQALPGPDYAVGLLERLAAEKRPLVAGT